MKLYIPPLRPNLVPRPKLIQRLDQGLQQGCKLILISAPAGFGKTTLVSEWITANERPAAWLSLDERDNDPGRFLTYFTEALGAARQNFGEGIMGMLQSPQPPPTESILTALLNEIATIPDDLILLLDDYHLIDTQTVDDSLAFLIEHLPPQLHLAIATREDPQLPLARYRARGQLTELRANDLRFTPAEAAEFLNQVMGLSLSTGEVASLESRTEGWIAGLQLAALSMQGREDIPGFIKAFAGDNRYIVDYLVEEVLQRQPEHIRSFLLQTSILDRLSGPLCDAVCFGINEMPGSTEDGKEILEVLERDNLFVIPLDDKRQWYRYHHLFADVLQARLIEKQPDQIAVLHRRASGWYEQADLPAEAIRHAIAAEDFERAAELAELAWPDWSGSFQSSVWLSWLKALPRELVRARPVLSLAYAWAYLNAGELDAARSRLLDVEQWLEPVVDGDDRPEVPSEMVVVDEEQFHALPVSLATARAYHAQAIGDVAGTVKYAHRVLELLPEGDEYEQGTATALLGLAQWASGDLEAAHRTFSDGLAGMKPLDMIIGTFVLADIKTVLGQLNEAVRACERALQLAMDHGEPRPLGTEDVYIAISKLHREWGELEVAAQDLAKARELGEQIELPDWQHRWCIAQAGFLEAQGDLDGALEQLNEAERFFVRTPVPDVRPIMAKRARIWIRQDRLVEAVVWAREQELSTDDDLSYLREFEHLTLARLLIARHESNQLEGAIQDALRLLEGLLEAAEEGERMGSVIEILVLQAIAHEARGDISAALQFLERALALAEPEDYFRIFLDEGPPMATLLGEAAKQGAASGYVGKLRAAFERVGALNPGVQPLIEPLSKRELEVLRLLSTELNGPEIARQLHVSLNTMRTHTKNIYSKLEVNDRQSAVHRAQELGLI